MTTLTSRAHGNLVRQARYMVFSLALSLFLSLTAAAQAAEPAAAEKQPEPSSHLAYFGFYASAMERWNFTAELAPFTNLTWIRVGSPNDPAGGIRAIAARLQEAKDSGVQAAVDLEPYLFANREGAPRSEAELEDFLVELRATLEERQLLDTVAMLYPKDEPFREFRRARDPNFFEEYVTGEVYDDIERDLDQVNRALALVFPEKPIGVILSGLELHHRFFSIPEGFDWVGFNCYANLFDACEGRDFYQLYGRLLANMTPSQRLIAVPEAWVTNEEATRPDFPLILEQRLRLHYEMVLAEPRFVAVVPFLWSFDAPEAVPGMGLDRFPELYDRPDATLGSEFVERVRELGRAIKSGTASYPNITWADTEQAERPNGIIYGDLDAPGADGLVRGRALDQALPHKNLRYRLFVSAPNGDTLFKTRLARTDRPIRLAVEDSPEDGVLLGTHGFEVQLPPALLEAWAGSTLTLTLWTYADGPVAVRVHERRTAFRPQTEAAQSAFSSPFSTMSE